MIFEQAFNIPVNHSLREIELTIRSFASPHEHWLHEEYDQSGNLVAKYTSWRFIKPRQQYTSNSGFRKYNCYGQLIKECDELVLRV